MVKNVPFVVPSGMLIPKEFLEKIMPDIDKELKRLDIN